MGLSQTVPAGYDHAEMEKEMEIDVFLNLLSGADKKYAKTWDGVVKKNLDMMKANQPQLAAYEEIMKSVEADPKKYAQRLFFLEGR